MNRSFYHIATSAFLLFGTPAFADEDPRHLDNVEILENFRIYDIATECRNHMAEGATLTYRDTLGQNAQPFRVTVLWDAGDLSPDGMPKIIVYDTPDAGEDLNPDPFADPAIRERFDKTLSNIKSLPQIAAAC